MYSRAHGSMMPSAFSFGISILAYMFISLLKMEPWEGRREKSEEKPT